MAAWIVFELSMLEHAFVCYCFEFYLLKAHELDDMETVKAFFTAFETDEQSVFGDDATTYGIHCILTAVTDIRYIKAHDPATRARSGWTLESLTAIFDVPTLGLVRLPEFEDASCISFSPMVYQRLPTATLCMPGCPPRHVCVAERRSLLTYLLT